MTRIKLFSRAFTFGPYCLMNHSDILWFDASNIVFSIPRRPMILAMMSARMLSACLLTSSASIIIMSAPASRHLSALLIKRFTSSTNSAEKLTKGWWTNILCLCWFYIFHWQMAINLLSRGLDIMYVPVISAWEFYKHHSKQKIVASKTINKSIINVFIHIDTS